MLRYVALVCSTLFIAFSAASFAQEKDFPDTAEFLQAADQALDDLNVIAGEYQYTRSEGDVVTKYEGTFRIERPNEERLARFSIRQKSVAGEDSFLYSDGNAGFFTIKDSSEMFVASMFHNGTKLISEKWKGGPTSLLYQNPYGKLATYGARIVGETEVGGIKCWTVKVQAPNRTFDYAFGKDDFRLHSFGIETKTNDTTTVESTAVSYVDNAEDFQVAELKLAHKEKKIFGMPKLKPGIDLSSVVFTDRDGKQVELSQYKGKVVVIDFWASWCAPCLKSIPEFQKLAATYDSNEVACLLVAWNDKMESSIKVAEREDYVLPILAIDNQQSEKFDLATFGIPCVFVIDQQGKLADYQFGSHGTPGKNALKKSIDAALKQ